MRKTYFISYWDRYMNDKTTTITARNEKQAESKFYKQNPKTLIKKISRI